MGSFFAELKRRQVFKVGMAYAIVAWLIIQIVNNIVEPLHLPVWTATLVIVLLVIGFPIALILAWAFEMTPEGVKRTDQLNETAPNRKAVSKGRKLDFVIIAGLAAAVVFLVWHQYYGAPARTLQRTAASEKQSIAVLPFEDFSPRHDQGYFADGISEEILDQLAQVQDLRVIGRTSSFAFKGKKEDLREIGNVLGVNHLLEGSVRKAGNDLRITAELIKASDGSRVWSKTYKQESDDIFTIQDDIARSVAVALQLTLGVGDLAQERGMTRNVAAYDEYLAGQAPGGLTPKSIRVKIDHLERAVALDPNFATAWASLNIIYGMSEAIIPGEIQDAEQKAFHAMENARRLAPNAPQVLFEQSMYSLSHAEWEEAVRCVNTALSVGKTALVKRLHGRVLYFIGYVKKAIDPLEQARSVEPLDLNTATYLVEAYAAMGNMAAAMAEVDRARKLGIGNRYLLGLAILYALASHDSTRIDELLRRYKRTAVDDPYQAIGLAMIERLGDPDTALAELRRLAANPANKAVFVQSALSSWAAYFGDQHLALKLFRGFADNHPINGQQVAWRPIYHDMRMLPGFKDYLRHIGLVDYWRKSDNWGDLCHPVNDNDFECK